MWNYLWEGGGDKNNVVVEVVLFHFRGHMSISIYFFGVAIDKCLSIAKIR